jgi:DNA-directed RNA polymerase beta' subunit
MSGARGNVGNIAATVVSVGQMYSGNDRYDPNVSRSSYYAPRDSLSIFDRGFIKSSYAEGLTQAEVMVVANVARRQALNTYLGTPASGNTANQTTRHQADIHLTDTLSVVDSNGSVLDCLYGYGCDSTMITYYKTPMGEIELPMDPLALLERVNNIL